MVARVGLVAAIELDVMSLDHAVESLAIDFQHARRRLFVTGGVRKHARDVPPFDLG